MSKEKKETKVTVNPDLAGENNALKGEIEALRKSGTEMGEKINSLNLKIRAYQAANTKMKKEIERCKQQAETIEKLRAENEAQQTALYQQGKKISELKQENVDWQRRASFFEKQIDWYNTLPWYRKIFTHSIS